MTYETTPIIRLRKPQQNWVDLIERTEEGIPIDILKKSLGSLRPTALRRGITIITRALPKDKKFVRVWMFGAQRGRKVAI